MPGPFHFAWIDAPVPFDPDVHNVEDEAITELQISQGEGGFAGLNMSVINPHVGLLAPGRRQWCWLSWDNGTEIVPLFTGRLVAVPESINREAVRLLFAARPPDYDTVKSDYADTLRVLPYFDPIWISSDTQDPDAVLNAYGGQFHIDRVTLEVTHSDELEGEDGTLTIGEADHLYDSFTASYTQPPLSRVDIEGTLAWKQTGRGTIDVTREVYEISRAHKSIYINPKGGTISTLTGDGLMSDWPKPGNDFGGGWSVNVGTAAFEAPKGFKRYSYEVQFRQLSAEAQTAMHAVAQRQESGGLAGDLGQIATTATSYFGGYTDYKVDFPVWAIEQRAIFDWAADRGRQEILRCSLAADIQALLAEPGAAENVGKIAISAQDTITEPDDAGNMAVGDTRRASYLNTDRGEMSLQYLLLLGRAELRRRARAIDIQARVPWPIGIAATLRKNAHVVDRRLPGGEAFGKITGYAMSASGTGEFAVDLTIGCSVGHGGSVTAAAGTPNYVELGYVDAGYQQMSDAEIMAPTDDLVYQALDEFPVNDDGIDLLHFDKVQAIVGLTLTGGLNDQIDLVRAVQDPIEALSHLPTHFCFDMRPVSGMDFETTFTPSVQPLPIPRHINLEA